MTREILRTSGGVLPNIEVAESCQVVATFADMSGDDLAKTSITTLTATLVDDTTGTIINSRNAQTCLDANGGALNTIAATASTPEYAELTLTLGPLDNINVGASVGDLEKHLLLLTWTWTDSASVALTGKQEWEIFVRPLTTPVVP